MTPANVFFLFVLIVAFACFSFSAQRMYRFLRMGKDEPRLTVELRHNGQPIDVVAMALQ